MNFSMMQDFQLTIQFLVHLAMNLKMPESTTISILMA